ncbi:MAG: hypothetical protein R3F31_25890 [Verrucomicrobiales bacterium]
MKLETVLKQDSGDFLWFHPRATAVPGDAGSTDVLMTIQKHLNISDYYSGLHFMTREGVNGHWTGPVLAPELDWKVQPDGVILSVADVTPGYHSPTGKVIDIGARLRYSPPGGSSSRLCPARIRRCMPFFFSNLLEMGGSTDVAGSAAQLRMEAVSADSSIHRSRKGLSAIIRDQMALTGV